MSNDTSRNGRGGSSRAGPAVPALLLDLDGVIYGEDRAIKGADEAVRWIQEQAIPHRFVTNTSSVPRAAIVAKLNELGIAVHEEAIVSPPAAAARWLEKNVDGPVALFVSEKTKAEFGSCALLDEEAESGSSAVVIGYLGDDWTFPALNRAFRLLVGHPKPSLLAMGMTRYWSASSGLTLDVGPVRESIGIRRRGRSGRAWEAVESLLRQRAKRAECLGVERMDDRRRHRGRYRRCPGRGSQRRSRPHRQIPRERSRS